MLKIYQVRKKDIHTLVYVNTTADSDVVLHCESLGEKEYYILESFRQPGWFDYFVRTYDTWSVLMSEDNA
jgi:hypothetical protein